MPVDADAASALIARSLAAGRTALNEWESKTVVAAYGVPIPEAAVVHTVAEAVDAAHRLGGRLAMKAVDTEIHHKTETGLVALNVEGCKAVMQTYRELQERAGGAFEGVLVERMVTGSREFMLGMKRDLVFGPVVAFGLGGIPTEALADVAFAVAPLGH